MDEEVINLSIGIWTVHSDGITSKALNWPEGNISKAKIWATRIHKNEIVWDLPFHLIYKPWVKRIDLENLFEAMAIHMKLYPLAHEFKDVQAINISTVCHALSLIGEQEDQ